MKMLLFAFAIISYSGLAVAGTGEGKVTRIFVTNDSSAVLFQLDSQIDRTPRCNEEKKFSIELRKLGGMASYMLILEAKREGYEIFVEGLNTCISHWKSEDVKTIIQK